jgi:hypothetical protein
MPLEATRYYMLLCILKLKRHGDVWWLSYNMRKRSWSGSKFTGESAYVVPTVQYTTGSHEISLEVLIFTAGRYLSSKLFVSFAVVCRVLSLLPLQVCCNPTSMARKGYAVRKWSIIIEPDFRN